MMMKLERVVPLPRVKLEGSCSPRQARQAFFSLPPFFFFPFLDVVDRDLLAPARGAVGFVAVAILVELEAAVAVFAGAERVRLVDLGCVGELAVGLAAGESQ